MSTSDKIKGMLALTGKKQNQLAAAFNTSKQVMSNKMSRDSWSAKDVVKAAEFCGCKVAIILPDGQQITLEPDEDRKIPDE